VQLQNKIFTKIIFNLVHSDGGKFVDTGVVELWIENSEKFLMILFQSPNFPLQKVFYIRVDFQ
jgi:hypothetical protein